MPACLAVRREDELQRRVAVGREDLFGDVDRARAAVTLDLALVGVELDARNEVGGAPRLEQRDQTRPDFTEQLARVAVQAHAQVQTRIGVA